MGSASQRLLISHRPPGRSLSDWQLVTIGQLYLGCEEVGGFLGCEPCLMFYVTISHVIKDWPVDCELQAV